MFTRRTFAFVLAVVLGAGVVFGLAASANAATLTIHPSGRDTANGRTGTWTVTPTNAWATALDANDGATTRAGGPTNADNANVFFLMDGITAPTGPITQVTIGTYAASGNGQGGCTMRLGVAAATGSAVLQPTAQAIAASTAYGGYSYSPATDPTGGAWDWSDISTLRAVVQQTTRPSGWGTTRQLRVTEAYITVTYTAQYTITASAGAGGSISPAGATTVDENTNRTYTITPNSGYHVTGVTVDGVSQGAITSYTFNNVTANHTIAATFALNTYTITSSAGANGSISPAGATTVNHGSNQSYTITPNSGYAIAAVTVDGVSQGAVSSYTFTNVTAGHTISATFVASGYVITTSPGANGTITPASPTVAHGANQTFLVVPNTGYHIANVVVDGASQGAIGSYTFNNVTAAGHTISATFAINQYVITTSPGANGTITPASPTVAHGADQTFAITPNTGYHVESVLVDGVAQGAATSHTFYSVGSNHTISATFALNTYTITSSAGANGSISPSGATTVNHGASRTYTITPNGGYVIANVLVDGVSQGAIASYTFSNVTAAHTISATFATRTYQIAASAGANGTISPSGNTNVASGANQTFSITPNTGYHVASVLVDGASQGAVSAYTFYSVAASHTISATFAINQYVIATSPGANGSITPTSPTVNHGANQSFAITPNGGYRISSVSVDGVSQGAISSYTFNNVTAGHTLAAAFVPSASTTFTVLSASAPSAGTVDVVFSNTVNGASIQTADFAIGGVSVLGATLRPDNRTVRLSVGSMTPGSPYTVSVTAGAVADTGGASVSAPLTATFAGPAAPWTESVPAAGVTVTFANATQAGPGATAVVPPSRHSAPLSFRLLPSAYRDIHSTTVFSGMATVTMRYNPSEVTGNPTALRLFHWTGSSWQDITTFVDTTNNTVSGTTSSFSDFALGEPTDDGGTGGVGTTRSPASSEWSIALLAAIGVGVLALRGRRRGAQGTR